jgi:hypothetical protein
MTGVIQQDFVVDPHLARIGLCCRLLVFDQRLKDSVILSRVLTTIIFIVGKQVRSWRTKSMAFSN